MIPTLTRTTLTTKRLAPEQYEVLQNSGTWGTVYREFYKGMKEMVELPREDSDDYRYFIGWNGDVVNIQRVHKDMEWK